MVQKLLLFASLSLLPFAAHGQGMVPPTAQAEAPIWLEVSITKVSLETSGDEKDVTATATVIGAFKAPESIKDGDTITIQYHYSPKPIMSPDGKRPVGPSSPPLLREGRTTYAFVKATDTEGVYAPAAAAWSFAPPFGISKEDRDKLGMKAPTPPSAPPPPPPNFQVPMKSPAPPNMAVPSTTPPPLPVTEPQQEEGTSEKE